MLKPCPYCGHAEEDGKNNYCGWSVDFRNNTIISQERNVTINLTPTQTDLMFVLVCAQGKPVTPAKIENSLWPRQDRSRTLIYVHMNKLRTRVRAYLDIKNAGLGCGWYVKEKTNETAGAPSPH